MLRGIHPLLSPDLLHALCSMGHGDTIVIADAHFPATQVASRLIRMDGIPATDILSAVLPVLPIEPIDDDPVIVMDASAAGPTRPDIYHQFEELLHKRADFAPPLAPVDRQAFYEHAQRAFVVVQSGETRHFGNIILTKGLVGESE